MTVSALPSEVIESCVELFSASLTSDVKENESFSGGVNGGVIAMVGWTRPKSPVSGHEWLCREKPLAAYCTGGGNNNGPIEDMPVFTVDATCCRRTDRAAEVDLKSYDLDRDCSESSFVQQCDKAVGGNALDAMHGGFGVDG